LAAVVANMSNIHTTGDYRDRPAAGGSAAAQGGPNRYRQQRDAPYPGVLQPEERGISLMGVAGPMPTLWEKLCPRLNPFTVTAILSVIQVIIFIVTLIVGQAKFDGAFVASNSMGGPSAETLLYMGGKYTPDIRDHYQVWRLITPVFLHAGILHIFFNLLFQCRFGFTFELRWTIPRYIIIYVMCGIGASLWSAVLSPVSVSVGASGALFGLLGADISYLVLNWAEIPQRGMEACTLVFVIIINLLYGISPEIDNSAHGGGLVTGLIAAPWVLPMLVPRTNEKLIRGISGAITMGVYLLFVLLIWVGNPGA